MKEAHEGTERCKQDTKGSILAVFPIRTILNKMY